MTTPHEHSWAPMDGDFYQSVCTSCGETRTEPPDTLYARPPAAAAGAQLATLPGAEVAALFDQKPLDIIAWATALAQNAQFDDDGDASPELDMVIAILTAETSAEAMAVTNVRTAEDLIGTEPGGHSPLLRITGARPLKSTFKEGPPCFAIIDATIVASGEAIKLSTGGRTVQAVILAHVNRGWLPFEAILTRRLKPTRSGFYPLNLEAGG